MNADRLTLRDPLMPKRKPRSQRKSARAPSTTADATVSGDPGSVLRPQREGSSDMERAMSHSVISVQTSVHVSKDETDVAGFLEPGTPNDGVR